jgi:hypothetical protein
MNAHTNTHTHHQPGTLGPPSCAHGLTSLLHLSHASCSSLYPQPLVLSMERSTTSVEGLGLNIAVTVCREGPQWSVGEACWHRLMRHWPSTGRLLDKGQGTEGQCQREGQAGCSPEPLTSKAQGLFPPAASTMGTRSPAASCCWQAEAPLGTWQ